MTEIDLSTLTPEIAAYIRALEKKNSTLEAKNQKLEEENRAQKDALVVFAKRTVAFQQFPRQQPPRAQPCKKRDVEFYIGSPRGFVKAEKHEQRHENDGVQHHCLDDLQHDSVGINHPAAMNVGEEVAHCNKRDVHHEPHRL